MLFRSANYNECVAIAKNADAKCIHNPNFQPAAVAAPSKAAPGKTSNKQN